MEKDTLVVSAFPGTGKSYYFKKNKSKTFKILDSDSSKFDKKYFPENYIKHIQKNIGKADIIFVSSHKEVRNALVENEINFILVYPDIDLKEEYLERYKQRGSTKSFIKLLDTNWINWISELEQQKFVDHYVLNKNEYIYDVFRRIMN